MDMAALAFEVMDDKFFMLVNFVFHGNASCFRCNETLTSKMGEVQSCPFFRNIFCLCNF